MRFIKGLLGFSTHIRYTALPARSTSKYLQYILNFIFEINEYNMNAYEIESLFLRFLRQGTL